MARYLRSRNVTCPCGRWASALISRSRSGDLPCGRVCAAAMAALSSSVQARTRLLRRIGALPEVIKVEPAVGIGAAILLQHSRVTHDRCVDRRIALLATDAGKVRQRLKDHVIAIAAAV